MQDITVGTSANATVPDAGRVTFGQIRTDIATYYGVDKDAEKEAFIGRILHDIIDDLNMKKLWRFNLIKSADITTVAGTSSYAVPADLWRMYSARKTDGIDFTLTGIQQSVFDTMFQSQGGISGFPYAHVDFNIYRDGTFQMFPAPDGAYTISLRYFKLIGKPSAASDTFDMPPPYQVVPKYGALARLGQLTGQTTTAQLWEAKFQESYRDMNTMDEDMGDEVLRFMNIEEMNPYSYMNPNGRPRYLDFW